MAGKAQVERTLRDLLKRLHGAELGNREWGDERTLACVIRDLDLVYRGTFSEGRISDLVEDPDHGEAHVTISVASDDLVALSEGRLSPVFAFLSGKLRVDADSRDMLLLRQLF